MKNFLFIQSLNVIGISYLILFFLGFQSEDEFQMICGGIGMMLVMTNLTLGQPQNQLTLIIWSIIGCLIFLFISKWWIGLFVVFGIFTLGQFPSLILFTIKWKSLIQVVDESEDRISSINFISLVMIVFLPLFFFPKETSLFNLIKNDERVDLVNQDNEIRESFDHLRLSYNSYIKSIEILNNSNEEIYYFEEIDEYQGLIQKSLSEGRLVKNSTLRNVHKDYQKYFKDFYLKGLELQIQGIEQSKPKKLIDGQELVNTFNQWRNRNNL